MASMNFIDSIKRMYPNPTKEGNMRAGGNDGYCVLGALFKYARRYKTSAFSEYVRDYRSLYGVNNSELDSYVDTFPVAHKAARLLSRVNPSLSSEEATKYCNRIISHNDSSHFREAWRLLSEALRKTKGRT